MKNTIIFLFLCMGLGVWTGCQTYQGTKFAPLDVSLQAASDNGARSLMLVNSSGKELHQVHFQAYLWGQNHLTDTHQPVLLSSVNEQPEQPQTLTYGFAGSSAKLGPGESLSFTGNDSMGESRVLQWATKVQISGSCDEGVFRETWVMNGNGQLELVGVPRD